MSTETPAATTAGMTAPPAGSRLDALHQSGLLDTPAEEAFDAITRAVTLLVDVPIALLSLVDTRRVYFKSTCGLGEPWASKREAPLTHTLCEQVVKAGELVAVSDFKRDIDPNFHPGLLAIGGAAYLGAPVRSAQGHVLGALCAIDVKPTLFGKDQIRVLGALAEIVSAQIDARRHVAALLDGEGPLRESERLHRLLVEQACDAILLSDSTGRILAANPAACEMLGYAGEALLARQMTDLEPESASPLRFEVIKAGKKMLRVERRLQRADGRVIDIEASARVVDDGRMLVVARQVGERKQTEEALRRSETRLRGALAAARVSDWEWDIGAGTVAMSPLAQSLHGVTDGAFESYQSAIHPDDRARVFRALKQSVETGSAFHVTYGVTRTDGTIRQVELRAGAISDEAGDTVRLVGICGEKTND